VDVLLEAWKRLGVSPERARLVITGVSDPDDGYVRGLQAGAPPGCEWIEMRRDITPMLHAADVLVLPSVWDEPFGRIVIEAMATGLPVVAAAVGGIPEIMGGEFAQMLFPKGDCAALAEQLRTLEHWRRDDPDLGARCIAHITEGFTLDRSVNQLERTFERALVKSSI
jgi:glycosyltransferase involved in cell wall biosynthesis